MGDRRFIGTGVALITPFKNGNVDFDGLEKIINHVIAGGADYLVMLGSTGETATLNNHEAKEILDFTIGVNRKRLPIVAGNFTGNNTRELSKRISEYNFDGIDAILSSSPGYVKPTQEGIFMHYMAMEEVSPVPIIIYNVPGRTQSNITWNTTVRLANASEKFIGIKEATGDLIQTTRIVKNKPDHFFVVSGDDEIVIPMISVGGEGVISVIGNALPSEFSKLIKAALSEDYVESRRINNHIYDLHKWLYIEGNPVGIKSAMQILGFCSNEVRLPRHYRSSENMKHLEKAVKAIL
ncbi:MAG: 4-hydroxy-tetrahydrodipicolinate synthase [Saprospiraceae bacterium]|nr:4-hydroxy-tetrahydrodipicolinate synthase [Saprospiraceae bacterium]